MSILPTIAIAGALFAADTTEPMTILVSPNILVTRDGNVPHVEMMIAANPKKPRNLLGASFFGEKPFGGVTTKTYASLDGGATWTASEFPELVKFGGGDPQVAFGATGTGYFATLVFTPDETGRMRAALYVYRSEDGGITWGKPADLGYSYDHEQIIVDTTAGRFAGRVYISALHGRFPEYTVGVFRSDDDGRTWTGPVKAASGGGKIGINDVSPLIFGDGMLLVPYADFSFDPEVRRTKRASTTWTVTSNDGGVTFSAPRRVQTTVYPKDSSLGRFATFPQFAVDNSGGKFRDRLYAVWASPVENRWKLMMSVSTDRGATWSAAKMVDPSGPADSHQYQAMAIVNKDGVLGISWFDTRAGDALYDQYFTASTDGGKTFLPAKRVSSRSSMPLGAGNLALMADAYSMGGDTVMISLLTAANRWPHGGDYMGLTADVKGVFHPFWADARNGIFQGYTAAVTVAKASSKPSIDPRTLVRRALNKSVELVFDPPRYDSASKTAELPIRLRNLTDQPIYGPVTVEITGFPSWGSGLRSPKILNASNGKDSVGAVFDYSLAFGDDGALMPHGLSDAIPWKMSFFDPLELPGINIVIMGYVRKQE